MPVGYIYISEKQPLLSYEPPAGWLWLKPTDDGLEIYTCDSKDWILGATVSFANHNHASLEDIVALLGHGVNGTKTIGKYKLTFNHGILTNFEEA